MAVKKNHLSPVQRIRARRAIRRAARLLLHHAGPVHYTQGSMRWQGIRNKRRSIKGEYPNYSDCSSSSTWEIWDAVADLIHSGHVTIDFVNGLGWRAGSTYTMIRHGKRISRPRMVGDMVFYGATYSPGHVAPYIGGGYVISHGSEGGPYLARWNYRPVAQTRRYILPKLG